MHKQTQTQTRYEPSHKQLRAKTNRTSLYVHNQTSEIALLIDSTWTGGLLISVYTVIYILSLVSRHASKMKYTSDLSILTKTINTTSATSGAGTAYPSGALEFTPGF